MFSITVLVSLLALAHAAPTPASTPVPTRSPIVTLCASGTSNSGYTSSDQATSTTCPGRLIDVQVGVTLSGFEQNPLRLRRIGIVSVTKGVTDEIVCEASVNNSSQGAKFSSKDLGRLTRLDPTGLEKAVTRLSCNFRKAV